MSKFEQMCKALADGRSTWLEYRNRCYTHMGALIKGFAEYCELPSGNLCLLPLASRTFEDKTYSLPNAMYFDPSDGYWHLDVCITLYETPNVYPHHPVRFALCLREADRKVFIKRGWDDKSREIDLKDKSQCDDFYAGIVARVEENLARKPQDLAEDESKNRPLIGFSIE